MQHQCPRCLRFFAFRSQSQRHQREVHGGVRQHCEYCGKSYSQSGTLNRHRKIEHNKEKKEVMRKKTSHQCPQCLKMFANKSSWRRHQNAIHEAIRHQCELCSKSYTLTTSLSNHRKFAHKIQTAAMEKVEEVLAQYILPTIRSTDQENPIETDMFSNTTATDTDPVPQSSARNETADLVDANLIQRSECEIATKTDNDVEQTDENGNYQIKIEEETEGVLFRMLVKWTTVCTECDTKFNIDDDQGS